jgi:hypothetical protein
MSPHPSHITRRRRLLQFLAASPLFPGTALAEAYVHPIRQNGRHAISTT